MRKLWGWTSFLREALLREGWVGPHKLLKEICISEAKEFCIFLLSNIGLGWGGMGLVCDLKKSHWYVGDAVFSLSSKLKISNVLFHIQWEKKHCQYFLHTWPVLATLISGPVNKELITIYQRNFLYISLWKGIVCLRSHCKAAPAEKPFSVTHFIPSNHINVEKQRILSS